MLTYLTICFVSWVLIFFFRSQGDAMINVCIYNTEDRAKYTEVSPRPPPPPQPGGGYSLLKGYINMCGLKGYEISESTLV